uniref:Putative secreted protein n=1 Tax=Anopheles marajoara TaxID=58244 RepID=A0A2M4C8C6_9DIPT
MHRTLRMMRLLLPSTPLVMTPIAGWWCVNRVSFGGIDVAGASTFRPFVSPMLAYRRHRPPAVSNRWRGHGYCCCSHPPSRTPPSTVADRASGRVSIRCCYDALW